MRVNGAAVVVIGGVIVRVLVDEWRRQSSSLKRDRQGEDA
jgi:hypothetical protein